LVLGTALNVVSRTAAEALVTTPFGRRLFVACANESIVESFFTAKRAFAKDRAVTARSHPLLVEALAQLDAYFAKRLSRFDLPLGLSGTPLQVECWRIVAGLEFGATCSYGDVANAAGRPGAHRAVAHAMARTPLALFVPAHRVVGADGRIKGTAATLRRRLLAFESLE
jgi:methylated-DNA-[protein]-cysteine S-methyltransferase